MPIEARKPKFVDDTNISLREYFDMRFNNLEKALDERFLAQEKAIMVANEASNKRLEGMNEFRESLKDQATRFATRDELNSLSLLISTKLDGIDKDIKAIQISDAVLSGKASQTQVIIAYVISILGVLFGIINLVK